MSREVLVYSANPADYPEYPDPCASGGNHTWQKISPFTTSPVAQNFIGLWECPKCREFADIPPQKATPHD